MKPKISLVVPSHNDPQHLKDLLKSIAIAKEEFDDEIQTIIVDYSDNEIEIINKEMCLKYRAEYYKGHRKVTVSRNIGINQAKAEIILFVDSDCTISPQLFEEHLRVYKTNPKIGGVLGLTIFNGKDNNAWKIMELTPFVTPFQFANMMEYAPWGTCTNISFRKDVLKKINGFNENLPLRLGGEDVDLGWRVNNIGYKIKCNPKAIVYHTKDTWSSSLRNIKKVFRWGRADFYLFKEHPQKRALDIPKYSFLFILNILVFISLSIVFKSIIFLVFPVIWLFLVILFDAYLKNTILKQKNLAKQFIASLLLFCFEFGFLYESLKRGWIKPIFMKILHSPNQLMSSWERDIVVKCWSITIATLIVIITTLLVSLWIFQ